MPLPPPCCCTAVRRRHRHRSLRSSRDTSATFIGLFLGAASHTPSRQQTSMLRHSHSPWSEALLKSLFRAFGGVPRPFSWAGRDHTDLLYSRHCVVWPEQGRIGRNRIKFTRSLAKTFPLLSRSAATARLRISMAWILGRFKKKVFITCICQYSFRILSELFSFH